MIQNSFKLRKNIIVGTWLLTAQHPSKEFLLNFIG